MTLLPVVAVTVPEEACVLGELEAALGVAAPLDVGS